MPSSCADTPRNRDLFQISSTVGCADDEAASSTVIVLAKEIGCESVDDGHLDASRVIENLGLLVEQLAYGSGFEDRVTLRAYVAS